MNTPPLTATNLLQAHSSRPHLNVSAFYQLILFLMLDISLPLKWNCLQSAPHFHPITDSGGDRFKFGVLCLVSLSSDPDWMCPGGLLPIPMLHHDHPSISFGHLCPSALIFSYLFYIYCCSLYQAYLFHEAHSDRPPVEPTLRIMHDSFYPSTLSILSFKCVIP